MLSCVFGKFGRASSTSDSPANKKEKYAANVTWELLALTSKKNGRKHYKAARARLINENAKRIFQVGDCVLVKGEGTEGNEKWAGQIIDFFEVMTDSGTVGEDANCLRVVLRWFYRPRDVDEKELAISEDNIKAPLHYEMFFSDAIETTGSSIECIIGRVFVRPTPKAVKALKVSPPEAYWKEVDDFLLVRSFYGSSEDYPRPLRQLEVGELAYLCKNPTTKDMYNVSLLFERHGHKVMDIDDGDSQASKNVRPDKTKAGGSSKGSTKKKPKRNNMETRPMYICTCIVNADDKPMNAHTVKKRKQKELGEIESAAPAKRPRHGDGDGDTVRSQVSDAAELEQPSQMVESAIVEKVLSTPEKNVVVRNEDNQRNIAKEEDELDDLEELELSPPKPADLSTVGNSEDTAVTGQETLEDIERETRRLRYESMSLEEQQEFDRKKEAYKQKLERMMGRL